MRRFIFSLALAVAFASTAGCAKDEEAIRKRLATYLQALEAVDAKQAWAQGTEEDRKNSEPEDYFPELTEEFGDVYREVMKKGFDWEIESVEVEDDTATATVRLEQIEEREILGLLMGLRRSKGEEMAAGRQRLTEKLESGDIPRRTSRLEYVLREEDGEWRIFFDRKHREKIREKLKSVRQDAAAGDLEAALKRLKEAREIPFEGSEQTEVERMLTLAEEGIGDARLARKLEKPLKEAEMAETDEEFEAALSELERLHGEFEETARGELLGRRIEALQEGRRRLKRIRKRADDIALKVAQPTTSDDGNGAVITGTISNEGEEPLNHVRITIDFMGESGERVHRMIEAPVDEEPLKAGESKTFEYEAPSVPPRWSGRVGVGVVDVK